MRYNLNERLRTIGMTSVGLLNLIAAETGERFREDDFAKAKHGTRQGPTSDRMLQTASRVLAKREMLLGIQNEYTK